MLLILCGFIEYFEEFANQFNDNEDTEVLIQLVDEYLSEYKVHGTLYSQFPLLTLPLKWTGKQFEMIVKEKGVQVFCCERFIVGSAVVEPAVSLAISTP